MAEGPDNTVVRSAALKDRANLLQVIASTELFPADELGQIEAMVDAYLIGKAEDDHWVVVEEEGIIAGVSYYAPERMTSGTWNLFFIGVDPRVQGKGYGRLLISFVEQNLTARGERLLLVETSGLPGFETTRAFYRGCGYQEEARIREFYRAGEDKIVYRKLLQPAS